jgi:type II secretion system protein J
MKTNSTYFSGNDGFSLIEVIVALSISSVLLLMIYSAHHAIIRSVKSVTEIAEFHENINLAIRRIDKDITSIYSSKDNKNLIFSGDNKENPPHHGMISFITINTHDIVVRGDLSSESHETDVKTVGYYLRADPEHSGLFFLMRSEKNLYDVRDEEEGTKTDTVTPNDSIVLENVTDLYFEFFAERQWDRKWQADQPPRAIRTTLKLKDYRGTDTTFVFISMPAALGG